MRLRHYRRWARRFEEPAVLRPGGAGARHGYESARFGTQTGLMLDDIDAVPWANLRHAFGAATDLPARIRALAAKDRDERQAALKELFARLVHQGSVFDATPRAVPFLFELLADESTPD